MTTTVQEELLEGVTVLLPPQPVVVENPVWLMVSFGTQRWIFRHDYRSWVKSAAAGEICVGAGRFNDIRVTGPGIAQYHGRLSMAPADSRNGVPGLLVRVVDKRVQIEGKQPLEAVRAGSSIECAGPRVELTFSRIAQPDLAVVRHSPRRASTLTCDLIGPDLLQDFKIIAHSGRGGQGNVYRVERIQADGDSKVAAIKVAKRILLTANGRSKRNALGLREVQIAQYLKDAMDRDGLNLNVLCIVKHNGDNLFCDFIQSVYPWLEGGSLYTRLGDHAFLHSPTLRRLVHGAMSGLKFLHDHRVVHGDIKPPNLLLTSDDLSTADLLVADFGLAQQFGIDQLVTSHGGTLKYQAPEIKVEEGLPYNGVKGDVYALGVTMLECVLRANGGKFPDVLRPSQMLPLIVSAARRLLPEGDAYDFQGLLAVMLDSNTASRAGSIAVLLVTAWMTPFEDDSQNHDYEEVYEMGDGVP